MGFADVSSPGACTLLVLPWWVEGVRLRADCWARRAAPARCAHVQPTRQRLPAGHPRSRSCSAAAAAASRTSAPACRSLRAPTSATFAGGAGAGVAGGCDVGGQLKAARFAACRAWSCTRRPHPHPPSRRLHHHRPPPTAARGALYECVTREKAAALPTHLALHCLRRGLAAGAAGAPALAHQWGGLPPAVPLRCLALALAYQDSGLGLAAAAAHAAALRQGAGAGWHGPPGLYACSDCCSAGTNAPPCPAHPT